LYPKAAGCDIIDLPEELTRMKKQLCLFVAALVLMSVIACTRKEPLPSSGQPAARATAGAPLRIGVLFSTTGTFSISESSMLYAAKMAIDEINASGGINGSPVEPVYSDYGSDPDIIANRARQLILQDKVTAIVGANSTLTRLALRPVIEENNSVLIYNTYYEGEEPSPNIIYTNSVPNQQIELFIPWIIRTHGPRIYMAGSDYEFPRKSIEYAKKLAERYGGTVVGEEYVPTSHRDFSSTINNIKEARPDAVFSIIAGDSLVPFYRQYYEAGIRADVIPICACATHEGTAKNIGVKAAAGHYSGFSYFSTLGTSASDAFVEKYKRLFGDNVVVTNQAAAVYHGVYLLKAALERAASYNTRDIIAAFSGLEIDAPAGRVKIDESNHHAWLPFYIGRINGECTFDIVYQSDGPIAPVPY
jgi:ABC-type branched-subunit amino acid transport system substrate-binding protein